MVVGSDSGHSDGGVFVVTMVLGMFEVIASVVAIVVVVLKVVAVVVGMVVHVVVIRKLWCVSV